MKTKYFILAAIGAITLASCSNDEFIGDNSPTLGQESDGSIQFSYKVANTTRADKVGADAATLLGNKFYVTGVKGSGTGSGQTDVFKTYSVEWAVNTAGKTESNTSDWEYVGKTHDFSTAYDPNISSQTIKYWDYNTTAYDFCAYSKGTGSATGTIINYSTATTGAYTLTGSRENLAKCYVTDMKTVAKADYGNEVQLQFRSLASKVRMAIYETVPGYSVKNVVFYTDDTTPLTATCLNSTDPNYATSLHNEDATLFGADAFYTEGTYTISFPHIGSSYAAGGANATAYAPNAHPDYNKAHVTFAKTADADTQGFGNLNYVVGDGSLATSDYLGRTSTTASFAGTDPYYVTVLPNETGVVLEMRVNYTLVSNDGSGEEISVHGAKAYVPQQYTQWLPNYAYTYLFKISDNTNGWTSLIDTDPAGLYPITFDAVVLDPIIATTEQTTITTVATPSITTYQKGHLYTQGPEYKAGSEDIFVQVIVDGNLKGDLGTKGCLYTVADGTTEAEVMDAINIQSTSPAAEPSAAITGRNGKTLTPATSVANFTTIPREDGNNITITEGQAASFDAGAGTYAYVYDTGTYTGAWYTSAPADISTANKYYSDAACTVNVTTWDATPKYLYQKDPTYIYSATTVVAGDETGWNTAGVWYIDPDGVTPVGAWNSSNVGKIFYKRYTVNHKVYGVKVIKVVE